MLTVTVGLVGSGKSSTRRPFDSRYSVMPSTEATFTGLAGAGAAFFGAACAESVAARRSDASSASGERSRSLILFLLAMRPEYYPRSASRGRPD